MSKKKIEEVTSVWEKRLMDIPGVIGIGAGLTKDRSQVCIKIYVSREDSKQADRIPKEIEGYPVEVETRKPFKAL
jgi:hypothetical protein